MIKVKNKKYRWTVVALLFFGTTINYIDRQVVGLLKPSLENQFNWTETDYSYIVMAFTGAYALGYLFFGRLIDKIGTKLGYAFSVVVWSIAAMGHALAKSTFGFGFWRSMLGVSEAGNFPAAIKAVAEWFPKKERALATGIFNSGTNIGAVLAPLLVPWILGIYGWQMAFILTGALGFIWLIFWWLMYEVPSKKVGLSKEEYDYIHSDADEHGDPSEALSWRELLKFRQTWRYIMGKFISDPIWWFFLFWLPSYFASVFDLDLTKPSLHLAILYSATTIGSIGGGYLSGYFIKKGNAVYQARNKTLLIVAVLVVPIVLVKYATGIWMAVGLISLAAGAHQAWSANLFTTASDMFPKNAVSTVIGMGGMAGAIAGLFFPLLVGFVLDYYKDLGSISVGYNILFFVCGFAYILAWGVMYWLSPTMEKVKL